MRHHPTLSPSSFPALAKCPGYRKGPPGPAAERGTRIHSLVEAAIRRPDCPTEADLETGEDYEEIAWAIQTIRALLGNGPEIEQEVSLLDADFNEITFGTVDYYADGHLVDLKTGDRRDYSRQMAVYGLALMDRDGLDTVTVSIVYSRSRSVDTYFLTHPEADALVWPVVKAVNNPASNLSPNSYCAWCSRRTDCPALAGRALQIAQSEIPTYSLERFFPMATPEQMAAALDVAAQAEVWADAVKAEAKRRMQEGESIPGWRLKQVNGKRGVSDPEGAFKALDLPPADFLSAVTVSISKLEDAYAKVSGLKKAEAKRAVTSILQPYTVADAGYTTLERAR